MKKFLLALLCLAGMTAFAACSSSGNANQSNGNEQSSSQASSGGKIAKEATAPFFAKDDECTTQGYMINADILAEIKATYGIDAFCRPKGLDIQNALAFTGENDLADVTDSFMFEFVTKGDATFNHDLFLGYAKYMYEQCLKAADDGKIRDGFWNNAKEISFDESLKVVDKGQNNRQKATFYFLNQGQQRKVQLIERQFKDGGFRELSVTLERN